MLDFLVIATRNPKKGVIEVYPKFKMQKSSDLMIRGGDFYAIWLESESRWSTDEGDVIKLIDTELDNYVEEKGLRNLESVVHIKYMWDADSGSIDRWHKYCQRQMRDCFHMLDEKIIFQNDVVQKEDYSSKRLPYSLEKGDTRAFDKLMSVLYSEKELDKIMWAIGAIVSGDSKSLQKFVVLYGSAGTGKSTVLNIIQELFPGYYSTFDAKALGSSTNSFALEAFKNNPLVSIQHDGDLSRIEDNTRLNSLVSHELMTVNEKFKTTYENRFKSFLFMGTNKPVKITEAKSGLLRRLIDVRPTGNKVSVMEYRTLMKQIKFELGGIAYKCLECYNKDPQRYEDYVPLEMLGASNDFYNFVLDVYYTFEKEDGISLKAAYNLYKQYCDDANVLYPLSKMKFKEEFKNYFWKYSDRFTDSNGTRVRNYYSGFRIDKFEQKMVNNTNSFHNKNIELIKFRKRKSIFDELCSEYPAQLATKDEKPKCKWADVKTKLSDIDTSKTHYVKLPSSHIVIDFDIPGEDGEKSLEANIAAASEWPRTYAELSKSGKGVHLHYIYEGDVDKLSRIYDDYIEIKVFKGKASLRRKLTKCNGEDIAKISSGLPLRKEKINVGNDDYKIKDESHLINRIRKALRKEIPSYDHTITAMTYIKEQLDQAYNQPGLIYDVTSLKEDIKDFAINSTNRKDECLELLANMNFKSKNTYIDNSNVDLVRIKGLVLAIYDIEIKPNYFLICYKRLGKNQKVVEMRNPSAVEVEQFIDQHALIGFNNKKYDNHIIYAASMGYTVEELYNLSQRIIVDRDQNAYLPEAWNLRGHSYVDIYDMCSKKQSLKKWQIELGIHHKEFGLPWDEELPDDKIEDFVQYCKNDVLSTEKVWEANQADFTARKILAEIADMPINTSTNRLTQKIIFGNNKYPQEYFNYRNLAEGNMKNLLDSTAFVGEEGLDYQKLVKFDEYTAFDDETGKPFFPGYKFENGVSTYRGIEVGEGGLVDAKPGMYYNIKCYDITNQHGQSAVEENLFGDEYTARYEELRQVRNAIKNKDYDKAKSMLDGKLEKYLTNKAQAKDLSNALKLAINSVYGLTAAHFDNPFRDKRNVDNIVAKRGALFMINLKFEVEKLGYNVIHIKTDSIKVENPDDFIEWFIVNYGKLYGYEFTIEDEFKKLCLVNNAVYVGKKENGEWTATGAQFKVPYVFKTLFSHEPIEFDDLCETKSVKTAMYLDFNEHLPDVTEQEKELKKYTTKYKKGQLSDVEFEKLAKPLTEEIAKGHLYTFIGKVSQFTPVTVDENNKKTVETYEKLCPIKGGYGGGILLTKSDNDTFNAVTGTKGYRWIESDLIRDSKCEDIIDKSYYQKLVDEAKDAISEFGDVEEFLD